MALERLIGQKRARRIIESMVEDQRLPHALLFWGPAGVGKSVAALELARGLNCKNAPSGPCGRCDSCVQFERMEHPHFRYLLPLPRRALADPETGDLTQAGAEELAEIFQVKGKDPYHPAEVRGGQFILIGQIRSLIQWANVKAFSDEPRLALIDRADRLKEEAGNALLKLLEEPPPNFILVLTVETPEDILETLRSRCHAIEFDRLTHETVVEQLQQRGVDDPGKARRLAHLSGGNLSRAIQFAAQPEQSARLHELAIEIVRHALGKSPLGLDPFIETWSRLPQPEQLLTLEMIASWLRDAALIQTLGEAGESRVMHFERLEMLKKFVENCPRADFVAAARQADQARIHLQSNVLPHLALFMMARNLFQSIYQRRPV